MTELEQALQQSLALMRADMAPMPLTQGQALAQAERLRRRNMTYGGISIAMDAYHGVRKSPRAWQEAMRRRGLPPKHYSTGLRVPPQLRERAR